MKKEFTFAHNDIYNQFCSLSFSSEAQNVLLKCPLCSSQRKKQNCKDLSVKRDGAYNCHHCGESGNIKFEYEINVGSREAGKPFFATNRPTTGAQQTQQDQQIFASPLNDKNELIKLDERMNAETDKLRATENSDILDRYAKERGLDASIYSYFNCFGYTDKKGNEMIAYPSYYKMDEKLFLVGVKMKPVDKELRKERTYQIKDGLYSSVAFLGYDIDLEASPHITIVEGEDDALACAFASVRNVISVPAGAFDKPLKPGNGKVKFLDSMRDEIAQAKSIVLFVDNDECGEYLEESLKVELGAKCRVAHKNDGVKDANDLFKLRGPEAVAYTIQNARYQENDFVYNKTDILKALVSEPEPLVQYKSCTAFDEFFTIRPREWSVFTGRPNRGKSTFVNYLTSNIVKSHQNVNAKGYKQVYLTVYSPEAENEVELAREIALHYDGKPGKTEQSLHFLEHCVDIVKTYKKVGTEYQSPCVEDLLTYFQITCAQNDYFNIFVIDAWNTVRHEKANPNERDDQYLERVLQKIKFFCEETGSHVIIVAHPNASAGSNFNDDLNEYCIAGGAMWPNKCNAFLIVDRVFAPKEQQFSECTITVKKAKTWKTGHVGECNEFKYDSKTRTYVVDPHLGVKAMKEVANAVKKSGKKRPSVFGSTANEGFPTSFSLTTN
jgi:5S rRNA maturation endonuclease (ribonuclease M5)